MSMIYKKKPLNTHETLKWIDNVDLEEQEFENKVKRKGVSSRFKLQVDRVHVGASENGNNIIQKAKTFDKILNFSKIINIFCIDLMKKM